MSREIKFRAWDKETSRMIIDEQGFIPLKITNKGVLRLCPYYEEPLYDIIPCDRFELMQFTGLYDKNCKEIYESDIVIINGQQYLIKFEIGSFMLVRCSGETDMYDQFKDCWNDDVYPISQYYWNDDSEDDVIHSLEVIGNIYENPELLGTRP